MAPFGNIYFGNITENRFSKTAAEYIYFKILDYKYFAFLTFDIMLKRDKFLWIFFK